MATKEDIKITVEFVEEKDVPPDVLARIQTATAQFEQFAYRTLDEMWRKRRAETPNLFDAVELKKLDGVFAK